MIRPALALIALLVVACGAPTTAPTTSIAPAVPPPPKAPPPVDAAPASAPAPTSALPDGTAPRPYTTEQLRDAMPVGHRIRYRMKPEGQPEVEERWEVTASTPETVTIATKVYALDGKLLKDEGSKTARWDALREHAAFPAAQTRIFDADVDLPDAGHFMVKRYQVTQADGSLMTFDFAITLPGPPVRFVHVTPAGQLLAAMQLLERK